MTQGEETQEGWREGGFREIDWRCVCVRESVKHAASTGSLRNAL